MKGDVSMCKVLDEYERRGIEKVIEKGIERTLLKLVKNNRLSVEVACEELNILLFSTLNDAPFFTLNSVITA